MHLHKEVLVKIFTTRLRMLELSYCLMKIPKAVSRSKRSTTEGVASFWKYEMYFSIHDKKL